MTTRTAPSELLSSTRVIAVLRAENATEYQPVIDALAAGGVVSIELTLSTKGVFDELPRLRETFGNTVELGVGTVTTSEQAERAIDSGAAYLVTPITDTSIVDVARRRSVPVYPGGFTPTELYGGWSAGATAVKVFPASKVGSGYVADLRGPFPDIQVIPSGGVSFDDAARWIQAGASAVSLGGPLVGDAFTGGNLDALTARAIEIRRIVDQAAS